MLGLQHHAFKNNAMPIKLFKNSMQDFLGGRTALFQRMGALHQNLRLDHRHNAGLLAYAA